MTNDQTQLLPFLVAPTIQLHPLIFGRSRGNFSAIHRTLNLDNVGMETILGLLIPVFHPHTCQ